ncbi:sugar transferase [Pseudorhodoferax aquiterrae]|uniref:Sugar transferase n=1 Tax=Pseudorhodoferax aquiterrae TaxID=747304 RepID=A0ABQ3G3L5_9BURK|nr:GtrA family protein [Pseudorhodoferax aquiterrae]GHC87718.1 sugar transferase [Pseudorhodoferax aquiterrae]
MKIPRWAKFLIGGGFNTIASYGVYLLLHLWFSYHVAYAIAYVAGIALSYVINSTFVFSQSLSWGRFFAFPSVYVVQYIVSASLLGLIVNLGVGEKVAPLVVSAVTVPATFVLTKLVLRVRG